MSILIDGKTRELAEKLRDYYGFPSTSLAVRMAIIHCATHLPHILRPNRADEAAMLEKALTTIEASGGASGSTDLAAEEAAIERMFQV